MVESSGVVGVREKTWSGGRAGGNLIDNYSYLYLCRTSIPDMKLGLTPLVNLLLTIFSGARPPTNSVRAKNQNVWYMTHFSQIMEAWQSFFLMMTNVQRGHCKKTLSSLCKRENHSREIVSSRTSSTPRLGMRGAAHGIRWRGSRGSSLHVPIERARGCFRLRKTGCIPITTDGRTSGPYFATCRASKRPAPPDNAQARPMQCFRPLGCWRHSARRRPGPDEAHDL